MNKPAS